MYFNLFICKLVPYNSSCSNLVSLEVEQQTAAKERQGVQVAGPGGRHGAYFRDGGLINFYIYGGFI